MAAYFFLAALDILLSVLLIQWKCEVDTFSANIQAVKVQKHNIFLLEQKFRQCCYSPKK
jgi:hypothetical protein